MATLARPRIFQVFRRTLTQVNPKQPPKRDIATSPKQKSSSESSETTENKNWISYGYNLENEYLDRHYMHSTFFVTITLCFVLGGTAAYFAPDSKLRDWAQREAYLELRRREELGLPPIDADYIDPAKVVLPSDEELGDTEIII